MCKFTQELLIRYTRKQFSVAQHLYRSNGFQKIEKYNDNEHAELYFELVLS